MGLLTNILLAPFLSPVWGTRWTLEQVDRVVRDELTDDNLATALEAGFHAGQGRPDGAPDAA